MNIALTGGTGFIGSHFLKQALDKGHSVLALRRHPSSKTRISLAHQPRWVDRQLDEITAVEMQGCDVLVHLAAHTGNVPYDSLINCLQWNLMSVIALFEQARLAGIQRFIVAGSCFEYGRSGENYNAIPSNAPLEPTNSYAASKAAASIALCQWADQHQVSLEILRVFHVFGEGEMESRLWPLIKRAAQDGQDFPMTEGMQIRDFLSVQDAASIFLARVEAETQSLGYNVYNIGSGKSQTIRNFAEFWWHAWAAKGKLLFGAMPYRQHEVMRYVPGPNLILPHS